MKNLIYLLLMFVALQATVIAQKVRPTKSETITSILTCFEQTAEGLVYISETDADVHSYISPTMGQVLTVASFIEANQIPEGVLVEQADANQWLSARVNYDSRWGNMQQTLTTKFSELAVFKVGTIQVQYYIVGIYNNRFVGIRTFSIET